MFYLIKDVELIKSQCVNLVKSIQAGDVFSISFDDIDDIVFSGIALETNIGIVDLVLSENGLDGLVADTIGVDHTGDCYATLVLLLEINVWRALVESNSETFEFVFDDSFVLHWAGCVQHDNNQIACSGHGDDLFTTTFTVFGTFDDTRQIQKLDF
jgi:hypothetical protein